MNLKNKMSILGCGFLFFSMSSYAATIQVGTETDEYNTAPNTTCSLREAIQSANINANFGGCVRDGSGINDSIIVPAGTYRLTLPGIEVLNASGSLDVGNPTDSTASGNLTINGASAETTILDGDPDSNLTTPSLESVINIWGGDVSIAGVTIRNGFASGALSIAQGGAISNIRGRALAISNSVLTANKAVASGGAIALTDSSQSLALTNVRLLQNKSLVGGAIYGNGGTISITDSFLLENNRASDGSADCVGLCLGGALYNDGGRLSITNTQIIGNRALYNGGGIYSHNGDVDITSSRIEDNSVSDVRSAGGGISNSVDSGLVRRLTLTSSHIDRNAANTGGGIFNDRALVTLTETTVNNNNRASDGSSLCIVPASCAGGGIYNNDGNLVLSHVEVNGNRSGLAGGGIYNLALLNEINDSTISQNTVSGAAGAGYGGAIYNNNSNSASSLRITNSTFTGNAAGNQGGAIFSETGIFRISGSSFIGNSALSMGGAIIEASSSTRLEILGSLFDHNSTTAPTGGVGGAIFQSSGVAHVLIANSTFSNNTTSSSGGGLYLSSSDVSITNATFRDNTASLGRSIFNFGTASLRSSLISNSSDGDDCGGSDMTSLGYNLDFGNSCNLSATLHDLVSTAPGLSSTLVGRDGSRTQTYALLAGSPAIDAGDNAYCQSTEGQSLGLNTDQLGKTRYGACDIGAFEFGLCGDGTVQSAAGEVCDDGNQVTESCTYGQSSCTVCNSACREVAGSVSVCGDGSVDAAHGEECDGGSDCDSSCHTIAHSSGGSSGTGTSGGDTTTGGASGGSSSAGSSTTGGGSGTAGSSTGATAGTSPSITPGHSGCSLIR